MKKQKLKLDALKVQSFVTSFDKDLNQTQEINGGEATNPFLCLLTWDCPPGTTTKTKTTQSFAGGCPTTF